MLTSTLFIFVTSLLAATLSNGKQDKRLQASDYKDLENVLVDYATAKRAPGLLRLAFHDFAAYAPVKNPNGGPRGCIIHKEIYSLPGNAGVEKVVKNLRKHVREKLPKKYPLGDVISLAGKVVVEKNYPEAKVKWRFGRPECNLKEVVKDNDLLPGFTATRLSELDRFGTRYGLNSSEFAMITIGAHALKGAANHEAFTGVFSFEMSPESTSFTKYLKKSKNLEFFDTWVGTLNPPFGRFISDMVWLPTVGSPFRADKSAEPVEKHLLKFKDDDKKFNRAFGKLFSKFLETGLWNCDLQNYD